MAELIEITNEVMDKINRYATAEQCPENVFCFRIKLCDNDIDRDYEKFNDESLYKLATLFLGKTGFCGNQTPARIYDTEVITNKEKYTRDGFQYKALYAYAYMVKTGDNVNIIKEIKGGIKREVSISCSVAKRTCSICGKEFDSCNHKKGERYLKGGDSYCCVGDITYVILENPTDAYEWAFIEVPAHIDGLTKGNKIFGSDETINIDEYPFNVEGAEIEVQTIFNNTTVVAVKFSNGFVIVDSKSCYNPDEYNKQADVDFLLKRIKDQYSKHRAFMSLASESYEI